MTQNTSAAVMAQRREPDDSLDWFVTPPWATRALCQHVMPMLGFAGKRLATVWEPACGDGAMVRPLSEYAEAVFASDVHDYGWLHVLHDFLQPYLPADFDGADWIISNPPFALAQEFVERALEIAAVGVAVLVRSSFIESVGRYHTLFRPRPPALMAQFVERVPMLKGRLERNGSTATAYCWLTWLRQPIAAPRRPSRLEWIPPCRAQLERAEDYGERA